MFNVVTISKGVPTQKVVKADKVVFALGNAIYMDLVDEAYAYDILNQSNAFYWNPEKGLSGSLADKVAKYINRI